VTVRRGPAERDGVNAGNGKEWKTLAGVLGLFAALYYLPVEHARFQGALIEAVR
jgi:hypothetical protein